MNNEELNSIPFFFIIGRPRSGTTLLRTLFDAHPNVIIPLECQIIKLIYEKYGKKRSWTENELKNLLKEIKKEWKFDTWKINGEKLRNDMLGCEGETSLKQLIRVIYSNYISHFEKKEIALFGDKNPEYSLYIDKLIRHFPEAKYIHITRDYRDQILSYMKFDFAYPMLALTAYRWKRSVQKVLKAEKKLEDSFYTIRYEDLVDDPGKYLKEMSGFLGITYDPSVLSFYMNADKTDFTETQETFRQKYHKDLFRPIDKSSVGLWKEKMRAKDVKVADMIVGKYAEAFGYNRESKRFNLPVFLRILPLLITRKISLILNIFIDRLPYDLKIKIKNRNSLFMPSKHKSTKLR